MINIWTVSALVLCYLLVLFALAFWADKRYKGQQQHPFIYSLALGVHCTSWALPLGLKIQLQRLQKHNLTPKAVLFTRRATVVVVMSIAYLYHIDISQTAPLVKSGIIAIALLSQTLPIIIGGLYWQQRNKIANQVGNVNDALSQCSTCPDLLFLDYHLDHGTTGIQAAVTLRQKWQSKIPAVLSSADRTEEVRKQAIDAQLHYLPKPIKPAALKLFIKREIH